MNGTIDINLGQKPMLTTAIHNYSASGTTANVDLSNYYNKSETDAKLNGKVSIIYGKQLSTNDYTTEEKNKLNSLFNYDDSTIKQSITDEATRAIAAEVQLQKNIDGKSIDLSNYALSSQLSNYETVTGHSADVKTLQTAIDSKLNKTDYVSTDLSNYYDKVETDAKLSSKVDVVEGKNLSSNDYTTAEKNKLNSLFNYDDSIVKQSVSDERVRATAAEVLLQKNIESKQAKGDYVSTSQLSDYETITAHTTDITILQSAIDNKLNKADYTPVDLSNYYQKNQTSGATQIAAALTDLNAKIPTTLSLKVLSQADYDALSVKDDNTVYFIQY